MFSDYQYHCHVSSLLLIVVLVYIPIKIVNFSQLDVKSGLLSFLFYFNAFMPRTYLHVLDGED